jgi:hypothetical protein
MRGRVGFRVVSGLFVVAIVAVVGALAYHAGVAQGDAANAPPGTMHPWGGGFGFFPFFPLLLILFGVLLVRGLFWRGAWHHGCRGHGVPPSFEEWHRRAHEERPPETMTRI